MDKGYYIEYYELERKNWWFKARLQIIRAQVARLARGRKDLKILNVGIATGATSVMLEEFGTVKSVEYDTDCYLFVKERLQLDLEQGSILDLKYANDSYDLVCAFDVIEHVADDQLAVNEMQRVCKPGGHVFVTVPAFMFLWGQHDVVNQHYRRYTRTNLNNLFPKNKIIFSSYMNSILFIPVSIVRLLLKLIPVKREGSGSDFELIKSPFLNNLLYRVFLSENSLLKAGIQIPFGVSVMTLLKK